MPKTQTLKDVPEEKTVATIEPPLNKLGSKKKTAVEEHTVVQKYRNEVRVDQQPTKSRKAAATVTLSPDNEETEDEAEDLDGLEDFFGEYSGEQGLVMEVSRLPNYDTDGRLHPRYGVYTGFERPFDPDTFLQDLSVYYARPAEVNVFCIRLKRNKRYVGGIAGPFRVEPASNEEKAKAGIMLPPQVATTATINQAAPVQMIQPLQPQDPMAGIKQTAEMLATFQQLGLVPKHREREQQNPAPVTAPPLDPEVGIIQLAMKDPETMKRIAAGVGSLIGGESIVKESLAEMVVGGVMSILQNAAPTLVPQIASYFQTKAAMEQLKLQQLQREVNGQPNGVQQLTAANGDAHQVQEITQAAPIEQPAQQEQFIPQPEDILFGQVLSLCQRRKMITPELAAKNLLGFIDQYTTPEGMNPFDGAMEIFLGVEAQPMIEYAAQQSPIAAALAKEPDVVEWITKLQVELRKEGEQDEQQGNSGN